MIKKKYNNEYYSAGPGLWVRNFVKESPFSVDINDLVSLSDAQLMLDNELKNRQSPIQRVETEPIIWKKAVIVSGGYNLVARQGLLDKLPDDVVIVGVNDVMNRWACRRRMNYYVINNPFSECMRYLPRRSQPRPRIIASERVFPEFLTSYGGVVYQYSPTFSRKFGLPLEDRELSVDDYRNPVCAAICLAFKFKVEKLGLFCCDDSFKTSRPGAVKLSSGLWEYPQHDTARRLIDGCLYWLKDVVEVRDYSSGAGYEHAATVSDKEFLELLG